MNCYFIGLLLCTCALECFGYYDPCSCDGWVPPSTNTRDWEFSLSVSQNPNNPPPNYVSIIADVDKSNRGALPAAGRARLNTPINTGCPSPFASINSTCEYRATVYLKTINGRTHFIVDRCDPPTVVYCICYVNPDIFPSSGSYD